MRACGSRLASFVDVARAPAAAAATEQRGRRAHRGLFAGDYLEERFFISRLIGEGGSASVYEAVDTHTGDVVVVKCLRTSLAASRVLAERLLREAKSAAQIAGPHVVRVLHVGLEDGVPFIVLERLRGLDLARMIRMWGPLPIAEACRYVRQASLAVADAHVHGFVHRDIKPANLFLTHDACGLPVVKVLDFGIVKGPPPAGEDAPTEITGEVDLLGSVPFMAPEQIAGAARVDERADVWSLGATLYYLLTGQRPFTSVDPIDTLSHILYQPHASLDQIMDEVPAELARIVDACLAKDPEQRWPSAASLAAALASYGREGRVSRESVIDVPRGPLLRRSARALRRRVAGPLGELRDLAGAALAAARAPR